LKTIIDTTLAKVLRKHGNRIELRFKQEEYEVDVEHQVEFQDAMFEITKGENQSVFTLLVVPGKYGSISKEAR